MALRAKLEAASNRQTSWGSLLHIEQKEIAKCKQENGALHSARPVCALSFTKSKTECSF
jgi:hypothetical protein